MTNIRLLGESKEPKIPCENSIHLPSAKNEEISKERLDSSSTEDSQWMGKLGFFSGNPTVETVKGILHIYKNK